MSNRELEKHLEYKVPQIRLAMIRERTVESIAITVPSDLDQFVEPLKHYSEEYFIAFHLNARHHVIGYHEVSHGTLVSSLVHPREVFKAALLANSHAIIVAHNHPGGSLVASSEDLQTTATLVKAGKVLGVSVVDYIIVSYAGTVSIRADYGSLFE